MKNEKSDAEWQEVLTPEQYRVTRKAGTVAPFTGEYDQNWEDGSYQCICCGHSLFGSESKLNAGCGWPSFHSELEDADIKQKSDESFGRVRTELVCRHCDAHLGHVFDDGPPPTGLRYCINSASIKFVEGDNES